MIYIIYAVRPHCLLDGNIGYNVSSIVKLLHEIDDKVIQWGHYCQNNISCGMN